MSPRIERTENPVQLIGTSYKRNNVYALLINLQTSDQLDPVVFDKSLKLVDDAFTLAFPRGINIFKDCYKWVGFAETLAIFSKAYDHDEVSDLLVKDVVAGSKPMGAGHLEIMPETREFWGYSQILTDYNGVIPKQESNKYKLEILPEFLGRNGFSFR